MLHYYGLYAKSLRGVVRHYISGCCTPPGETLIHAGAATVGTFLLAQLAGLGDLMWMPAGILFLILLLLMTGDLITEYMAMPPQERAIYLWEREITGKVLLISLVVMSLLMDVAIYVAFQFLPDRFLLIDGGFLFVTFTTMLWLGMAEVARITRNIANSEGIENIPPTINMVARRIQLILESLRFIDAKRARASDAVQSDTEGKLPPPNRPGRWYEQDSQNGGFTNEDVMELAKWVEQRLAGKKAPLPEVLKSPERLEPAINEKPKAGVVAPPPENGAVE